VVDAASLEYARSVARALLVKAKIQRKQYAVVILAGEPVIRRAYGHLYGTLPRHWDDDLHHNNKLVGVYDWHAELDAIADDIVATLAGEYTNRACVRKTQPER
jgi:hypothetical protein